MSRMSWELNPAHLGLMFFTISPGFGNSNNGSILERSHDVQKALIETAVIAGAAAYITKSWWPLVGPFAYLAIDQVWHGTKQLKLEEFPPDLDNAVIN